MENEELVQCLKDMQEAVTSLNQRNESTFKLNTEATVNSAECLKEIKDLDKDVNSLSALIKETKSIEQTRQLLTQMERVAGNLQLHSDMLTATLKSFPSKIKTEVNLRFEGSNRTIFVVVVGLILLTTLFAGLWTSAWQKDKRLKENDLKYRYLMLQIPDATLRADSLIQQNYELFKARLEQMEDYQRAQQQAQAIAEQKIKEAQEAGRKMKQLKKTK